MKKLTLALFGALALNLAAAPLTPEQALRRAVDDNSSRRVAPVNPALSPKLLYTVNAPETAVPGCYVFSAGDRQDGFMVLSADDAAVPVLGYGDTPFDVQNIPPSMQFLLDQYAYEIAQVSKSATALPKYVKSRPEREAIAPMIATKWDQDAPYNLLCPKKQLKRCYTGCVATALAQVANYYKWPQDHGEGTKTYNWDGKELSFDYSETTFDWDNMLDTYPSTGTSINNPSDKAVATLMYAIGVAAEMQYGTDESGAYDYMGISGMKRYMRYNKNAYLAERRNYGIMEWENLVYDNLSVYGPMYFSGAILTNEGDIEGGHAFVCDGYSADGYFHFNWGWSGMADGYFMLNALDPTSLGIGAGSGGYNYEQMCSVGLVPDNWDVEVKPFIGMREYDVFNLWPQGVDDATAEFALTIPVDYSYSVYSISSAPLTAIVPGLRVESAEGTSLTLSTGLKIENINPYEGFSATFTAVFPSDLADDVYKVYPGFEDAYGDWHDIKVDVDVAGYVYLVVKDGNGKFEYTTVDLPTVTITDIELPLMSDVTFDCSTEITNPSDDEFFGKVLFALVNPDDATVASYGGYTMVSLLPHETQPYVLSTTFADVAVGKYYLVACVEGTEYLEPVSDFIEVEVVERPEGDIEVKLTNVDINTSVVGDGMGVVDVSLDADCTSGVGEIYLCLTVYDPNFDEVNSVYTSVRVTAGNTKHCQYTLDVDGVEAGETYYLFCGWYDETGTWRDYEYHQFKFDTTGIDSLASDDATVTLYDLMGRPVQGNHKGVMIRVKTMPDGSTSVDRIIR